MSAFQPDGEPPIHTVSRVAVRLCAIALIALAACAPPVDEDAAVEPVPDPPDEVVEEPGHEPGFAPVAPGPRPDGDDVDGPDDDSGNGAGGDGGDVVPGRLPADFPVFPGSIPFDSFKMNPADPADDWYIFLFDTPDATDAQLVEYFSGAFSDMGLEISFAGIDGEEYFIVPQDGVATVANATEVDGRSTTPGRGWGVGLSLSAWAER